MGRLRTYDRLVADEGEANVRRLVLRGDRFTGGRLPVDSLVELERYQELVRTLAKAEWEADHEGEPSPAEFETVGLTIVALDEGSADVTLVLERPAPFASYVDDSADTFGETLRAAYDGGELPELPSAVRETFRALVAQFGNTLGAGDSIAVHQPALPEPVVVTPEKREEAIVRLRLEDFFYDTMPEAPASNLQTAERTLIGRFTAIDADRQAYVFKSLSLGPLNGRYHDHSLTSEITALVESTDLAPITRVVGVVQYKNERPWRIRETTAIERFSIDDDRSGARLIELAALPDRWGDDGEGQPIVVEALEAARDLMRAITDADAPRPAIFPTTAGGVLVEWASSKGVRSIEITASPTLTFELFELATPFGEPTFVETPSFTEARAFAVETRGAGGDG